MGLCSGYEREILAERIIGCGAWRQGVGQLSSSAILDRYILDEEEEASQGPGINGGLFNGGFWGSRLGHSFDGRGH